MSRHKRILFACLAVSAFLAVGYAGWKKCTVGVRRSSGGGLREKEPSFHGNNDSDLMALRTAIAKDPSDASLHEQLSVLLQARGDTTNAEAEIATAVRLSPSTPFFRLRLGDVHLLQGKTDSALHDYLNGLVLIRSTGEDKEWSPVIAFQAAGLLEKLKRPSESERYYEKGLAFMTLYRSDWLFAGMDQRAENSNLGQSLERNARRRLGKLRIALARDRPTNNDLARFIPRTEFPSSVGEGTMSEDARRGLEDGLAEGRVGGSAFQMLGHEYLRLGRTDDALILLLAAVCADEKDGFAWDGLAWAYLMHGRLAEAEQAFRKAGAHGGGDEDRYIKAIEMARKSLSNKH